MKNNIILCPTGCQLPEYRVSKIRTLVERDHTASVMPQARRSVSWGSWSLSQQDWKTQAEAGERSG